MNARPIPANTAPLAMSSTMVAGITWLMLENLPPVQEPGESVEIECGLDSAAEIALLAVQQDADLGPEGV